MRADLLAGTIAGLDDVLAAVDAFDQVLVAGLLRPQPAQAAGLTQLAHAVAGTPLASRVAEAAEKAAAGAAGEDHFVALAAARTALLGSVHDALMARVAEATGRPAARRLPQRPAGKPRTCLPPAVPGCLIWRAPGGGTSRATWSPAPRRGWRASVSVPKPDTIIGAGVWQLLRPHMSLLAAVSQGRSMDLADMPVTAEGDLIWSDDHARPGEPTDPFATARVALPTATDAATAPLDRHPARIAVPIFLEGYAAREDGDALVFTVAGHPLAVDTDRIPAAGPLTPEAVATSGACIGLLRWDAGSFNVQPLAVETTMRKEAVAVHAGGWAGGTTDKASVKAEKAASDAASVLRERAGKLLRK